MRLLIVEDEAVIARDLAITVETFGHIVVGMANSGAEALALAMEQRPDLALMDIRLSGPLDGIATAQRLQEQQRLPVLYLTAHADAETMRRAATTNPAGYLLKPFDERTLWSTLELVMHQRQLERRLQASESALRESSAQLAAALRAQARRMAELIVLGDLGRVLMGCTTLEEGYAVVAQAAQELFLDVAGTLYVVRQTPPILDPVITWSSAASPSPPLCVAGCQALCEGQLLPGMAACPGCHCVVAQPGLSSYALCVPLRVAGETLGALHMHLAEPTEEARIMFQQLTMAFGEQAALGLANIQLRNTLREQAIRDPLTGLLNRRYLEETLIRELHRATRDRYPVGIMMIDVDHFKQINDTYGHDAGDAVLRTLGAMLLGIVRAGDMVCRYGGEEFVLVLPKAPLSTVVARAEVIREAVSALAIPHNALVLPQITISVGVSVVADTDGSVAAALARADAALYLAKRDGRNRVMAQESGEA